MEWLVIGISGVTCGGKTTLAHSLLEYLQSHHNLTLWPNPYKVGIVRMISQDNYFLPVQDERHQWLEQINAINFELLTSLDIKQMLIDISWIMCGNLMQDQKQLQQQQNDYQMLHNQQQQHNIYYNNNNNKNHNNNNNNNNSSGSGSSSKNIKNNKSSHHHQQQQQQQKMYHQQTNLLVNQNNIKIINILIVEGFIIFNQPELYKLCNIKYHFHLPYEKCYERRQKRTYDPPDVTGYFELCVWPHYEKSLSEYRHHKDIIYLNGEIERERIFKYVLRQISAYFDETRLFTNNPTTSLSASSAAAAATATTTSTLSTTSNVQQMKQDTVVNLNLRMLRHQQQPILIQQQQQYQHAQQQQQQQEHQSQQQLCTNAMQQ